LQCMYKPYDKSYTDCHHDELSFMMNYHYEQFAHCFVPSAFCKDTNWNKTSIWYNTEYGTSVDWKI